MISKRSFIKLLKDDVKKRSWLWILSFLAFCLLFPGIVLDNIQGMIAIAGDQNLTDYFMEAISYSGKNYYLVAVGLMAMACALSGFSYIHSKSKLDFYHSLPVKRGTWLSLQFVSSILMFAVPTAFQVLEELFMGLFYHVLNVQIIRAVVGTFLLYFLIFLGSYFICVLAMLMTGKLLVSFLFMPVLFGFTGVVAWIYRTFQRTFFEGFVDWDTDSSFLKYPSPWTLMKDLADKWSRFVEEGMNGKFPVGALLGMAVGALALAFLCSCLYRSRKTESAGISVVFPKIAVIIEFFAVVAASLGVAICLKTFSYTQSDVWFFGGMAVGILVFTALMDFVYCMDIRGVLRKPLFLLMITAVTFGIALTFRFDLLGYDTYLPDKSRVASMSVDNYGLSSVYHQVLTYSDTASSSTVGRSVQENLDSYQMTEFEPIYAMAENGSRNAEEKGETSEENRTFVSIRYNLTSGKNVYRSYWVDDEVFEENAAKLYEKPGFIKAMYPIFGRSAGEVDAIYASGVDSGSGYYRFDSQEEKEKFLEAFKADLLTLKYSELNGGDLIGNLAVSYRSQNVESSIWEASDLITDEDNGYPILRRFTRTIAVLEEFGISFPDTLDPDEVRELSVWDGNSEETVELLAVEAGQTDLISDTQKRELIEMLSFQYCTGNIPAEKLYYITAYGNSGEYLQTFIVPAEDLPEDIQKILEENS